jgi:hypothetical protein
MRQLGRVNLRGASYGAGICLVFNAQMDASSLRQRKRLNRAEGSLAKDGIDVTDHARILITRCHVVEIASQ